MALARLVPHVCVVLMASMTQEEDMRKDTDEPLIKAVGERIRKLRLERGLSLREFGKRTDVHPWHIMAIELGQVAANIFG